MNKWVVYGTLFAVFVLLGYIQSFSTAVGPIQLARLSDLKPLLDTGDLLFTRGKSPSAKIQQFFFGAYVNHCAMVYKDESSQLWVWSLTQPLGAHLCKLDTWLKKNWSGYKYSPDTPDSFPFRPPYVVPQKNMKLFSRSSVYVRRLSKPLSSPVVKEHIYRNLGRPYSWRFWLSAYVRFTGLEIPLSWGVPKDNLGMFCSEMLAHTFQEAGVLSLTLDPTTVLPVDFWENKLTFQNGYSLGAPVRVFA